MQEHHLIAVILTVSLLAVVPLTILLESISSFIQEAKHNRQRVRTLNQQNYELRDEIARLTRNH